MTTTCRWESDYRGRHSDLAVAAAFEGDSLTLRAFNEGGGRLTGLSSGHVTFTWAKGPLTKLRSDNPGFDINTLLPGHYSEAKLERDEATHYSWDIRAMDSARDQFVYNVTPSAYHIPWGQCPALTPVPALPVWGVIALVVLLVVRLSRR